MRKKLKKKKKNQKRKKSQKKKEEAKKKPADDDDDDEEKPKAKAKDPLTLLPPSTFILDDFKRDFVNATDKNAALENFFKSWDNAGWSCWLVKYINYGDDG